MSGEDWTEDYNPWKHRWDCLVCALLDHQYELYDGVWWICRRCDNYLKETP